MNRYLHRAVTTSWRLNMVALGVAFFVLGITGYALWAACAGVGAWLVLSFVSAFASKS